MELCPHRDDLSYRGLQSSDWGYSVENLTNHEGYVVYDSGTILQQCLLSLCMPCSLTQPLSWEGQAWMVMSTRYNKDVYVNPTWRWHVVHDQGLYRWNLCALAGKIGSRYRHKSKGLTCVQDTGCRTSIGFMQKDKITKIRRAFGCIYEGLSRLGLPLNLLVIP